MAQIDYAHSGDYCFPLITLNESPRKLTEPITKYGAMRRRFLKEHHPITYSRLVLTEQLYPHLREVQAQAQERLDNIVSDYLVFNPPPDKATDGFAWAAHMEAVHRAAEMKMLNEVVYV